jgi:DNA modification methylase
VILDPFTGSGTSLCAAEISGRRWIGIELSENYSKVAQDRVQHFIDRNKQMEMEFK